MGMMTFFLKVFLGDTILQIPSPPLHDGLATPDHRLVQQSFSNRNLRHSKGGKDLPIIWRLTMLTLSRALGGTNINNQESLHHQDVRVLLG